MATSYELDTILDNIHMLVLSQQKERMECMAEVFAALGAHVHFAESQLHAIGMYFKLFRNRCIPRVVVMDWWTHKPGTPQNTFLKENAPERFNEECTTLRLIKNILDMDPKTFICVYTIAPDEARATLEENGITVKSASGLFIFDKEKVSISALATMIAEHEQLLGQSGTLAKLKCDLAKIETKSFRKK